MTDRTARVVIIISSDSDLQYPVMMAARLMEMSDEVIAEAETNEAKDSAFHLLDYSPQKLSELKHLPEKKFEANEEDLCGNALSELVDARRGVMDALNFAVEIAARGAFANEAGTMLDMLHIPIYQPDVVLQDVLKPAKPHHRFPNGGNITSARGQGARHQRFVQHQKR